MLSDPTVMQWLFFGVPMKRDEIEYLIDHAFTFGDESAGLGALIETSTEKFVGFAGLLPYEYRGLKSYELGFALQKESWGKGYATEIGKAQIEYAFDYLNVDQVFALTHPKNAGSCKVLENIGMKHLETIETTDRGTRRLYSRHKK